MPLSACLFEQIVFSHCSTEFGERSYSSNSRSRCPTETSDPGRTPALFALKESEEFVWWFRSSIFVLKKSEEGGEWYRSHVLPLLARIDRGTDRALYVYQTEFRTEKSFEKENSIYFYSTRPAPQSFERKRIWGQIRLVLKQMRSVGRAGWSSAFPTDRKMPRPDKKSKQSFCTKETAPPNPFSVEKTGARDE